MHTILTVAPLLVAALLLLPLGSWARAYFEGSLLPTSLDEGR